MISVQKVIVKEFIRDEQTGYAVYNGTEFEKVDDAGTFLGPVDAAVIFDEYMGKGLAIPAEFVGVRAVRDQRVAELQAQIAKLQSI